MADDLEAKLSGAAGLARAVKIAQNVIDATDYDSVAVMLQGGADRRGSQFVLLNTDPEAAQVVALVKTAAARRQTAQKSDLSTKIDDVVAAKTADVEVKP